MKKIGFFNSKGGCGKTTSLFHIAGVLADNGMKVLAVDLDKQGDTTNALLSEDESEYSDNGKNVLDFFRGDAAFEDVVKKNYTKKIGCRKPTYVGIDVLPYSPCPPSNRAIEKIVLEQLADGILVPMSSDLDSIRGYGALVDKVDQAREKNVNLNILGIYMSMYDGRVGTQRELLSLMRSSFDTFIDVQIPHSAAIVDSKLAGRPISFYKKTNVKDTMEQLTQEIINRL